MRIEDDVLDRAFEVQGLLADRGGHRLPIPDLVFAAAAASVGLTVLHYGADFERIAAVTGQSREWVLPCGTVSLLRSRHRPVDEHAPRRAAARASPGLRGVARRGSLKA